MIHHKSCNCGKSSCSACRKRKKIKFPSETVSTATLVWGNRILDNIVEDQFLHPGYGDGVADIDELDFRMPSDSVLRNMQVHVRAPGQGAVTITYRLFVNGLPTALVVPLLNTQLDGANAAAVTVAKGDRIGVHAQLSGLFTTSQTRILVSIGQGPVVAI